MSLGDLAEERKVVAEYAFVAPDVTAKIVTDADAACASFCFVSA